MEARRGLLATPCPLSPRSPALSPRRLEAENADLVRRCSMVLPPEIVEVAEPPKDAFIDVFLRVRPHYEKRAGSQSCLHVKDRGPTSSAPLSPNAFSAWILGGLA